MFEWLLGSKKYKNLSAYDFETALNEDIMSVLIDVRGSAEFEDGAIKGAININLHNNFEKKILELDKDRNYYLYCQSGLRSGRACKIMAEEGFTRLYNLKGGLMSWKGKLQ